MPFRRFSVQIVPNRKSRHPIEETVLADCGKVLYRTLVTADNPPCPVAMGDSKGYGLGTLLRDPVIVMLIHLAQVSSGPGKQATTQDSFHVHGKANARCVRVPLKGERRPFYHHQCKVARQPAVHLPQLRQTDIHAEQFLTD